MLKLSADNLDRAPGIAHGFFGRRGGRSTGLYATLNCGLGSHDVGACVDENRRLAMAALSSQETPLLTLHQIHSADAVVVDAAWNTGHAPKADAMATHVSGLALGILTADCAPVLLADSEAGIVGAAHAGWKGALGGVIESVVDAMERLGARRLRIAAAIGPCISQSAYEVADDLRIRVLDADNTDSCFFVPAERPGHWHFNLPAYARKRLERASVRNIVTFSSCTYAQDDAFYSFRRATHRNESEYGRQLSAIMLTGPKRFTGEDSLARRPGGVHQNFAGGSGAL